MHHAIGVLKLYTRGTDTVMCGQSDIAGSVARSKRCQSASFCPIHCAFPLEPQTTANPHLPPHTLALCTTHPVP